ncbi:hypothetical protein F4781DRAFT_89839 [Annulohypoxylon bovei var. microspora]|nr:hypothetical protein F4781DRAFT_89839 [Annulohypoxylon bovei var. microspora]
MFSPMPVYSYSKESQQHGAMSPPETSRPSTACSPTAPIFQIQNGHGELVEPSIEGPPSPERLRALNNQMKRNSNTDRHRSDGTSSGASSRLSGTLDRRSWNQSLENLSLSRNPSQRSASIGMPSRERTDSMQFFSKGMFTRSRGRLRRESSDQSSSNSSLDASEMPIDAVPAAPKDQPFISSVFARRRALRGETSAPVQKKLQISGPYNFQHLTHTRKDSVSTLNQSNRLELVPEFSGMRPRRPTNASLSGTQQNESQHTAFPSATFYHQEDPSAGLYVDGALSRDKALPSSPPPPPPPTRFTQRSQSQDKIRYAPPRPPRSPPFDSGVTSPIPPPPRTSSRISFRHTRYDSLTTATPFPERAATSTGFRKPEPFAPISPKEISPKGLRPPPAPRSIPMVESVQEETESEILPRAITTDDAAWPLANNTCALPDVPEEEEHHAQSRPSRMSVASNHSSLRGSISVPLLRQLSLTQSTQRSPSNASDTLGLFNAQRLMRTGTGDDFLADDEDRDNWEDDIDYCYEHEAEADCDYAWERPSCDISRVCEAETIITFTGPFGGSLSSDLLSPGNSDVPALSPASQSSNMEKHEAITPLPVTSNFSLPRRDSSAQFLRVHKRTQSPETNFKESQGFSLSPSLLIPNDYHQQMLHYEREDLQDSEDEDFLIQGNTFEDQPVLKLTKTINVRSSASTTDSTLSEHSMGSSRHKSTNSTSTAYTRWTGSSTSSWTRDPPQPILPMAVNDNALPVINSPTTSIVCTTFEEMALKQDKPPEKHSRTQSHAGLLMRSNYDSAPPMDQKPAKEPIKTRRRARTTSRSHASPQFALFPTVATHGNRI